MAASPMNAESNARSGSEVAVTQSYPTHHTETFCPVFSPCNAMSDGSTPSLRFCMTPTIIEIDSEVKSEDRCPLPLESPSTAWEKGLNVGNPISDVSVPPSLSFCITPRREKGSNVGNPISDDSKPHSLSFCMTPIIIEIDSEVKSEDRCRLAWESPATAWEKGIDYFGFGSPCSQQLNARCSPTEVVEHPHEHDVKIRPAEALLGCVWQLSQDKQGCRVVQQALDECDLDARMGIALELKGHICEAMSCPHANHVLQKIIATTPSAAAFIMQELIEAGPAAIHDHSKRRYGCRIIIQMLDCSTVSADLENILLVDMEVITLCTDRYGNIVVQHLLGRISAAERQRLQMSVMYNLEALGTSFYGCGVLNYLLSQDGEDQFPLLLTRVLLSRRGLLACMNKYSHGKAAVQSVIAILGPNERKYVEMELDQQDPMKAMKRHADCARQDFQKRSSGKLRANQTNARSQAEATQKHTKKTSSQAEASQKHDKQNNPRSLQLSKRNRTSGP